MKPSYEKGSNDRYQVILFSAILLVLKENGNDWN